MNIGFELPVAYRQLRHVTDRGAIVNSAAAAGDRPGSKKQADDSLSSERTATAASADTYFGSGRRPAAPDYLEALRHGGKPVEARAVSTNPGFKPGSPGKFVLSAMIEQMSGADMPPRKGVFIDYRV